jgi:hypothetical protein
VGGAAVLAAWACACSGSSIDVPPETTAPLDAAGGGASAPDGQALPDDATVVADSHRNDAASAPLCSSLPLCDGFESVPAGGPPSPMLWSVVSPNCSGSGKLAVDDAQAHGGTHSVRVDGGGGYCDHVFFANASVMPTLGDVYARFFVRLSAPLGWGHTTFVTMKDKNDNGKDVRMGGQDMVLMYNRESDDATIPVMSPAGTAQSMALAAGRWYCLEFHFDESAGTIDTWVDGSEVSGLVETGASVPDVSSQWLSRQGWKPLLLDLKLGWESYSGMVTTLWFDDVALASQRIGCGP